MNWIRRKPAADRRASVLTARVFARPGTPSRSTWPSASSADQQPLQHVALPDDHPAQLFHQPGGEAGVLLDLGRGNEVLAIRNGGHRGNLRQYGGLSGWTETAPRPPRPERVPTRFEAPCPGLQPRSSPPYPRPASVSPRSPPRRSPQPCSAATRPIRVSTPPRRSAGSAACSGGCRPAAWSSPLRRCTTGTLYIGSGDGLLYALDAQTGAHRWQFRTGRAISSTPAVADGLVFLGSRDNTFWAVDARTGKERWRLETGRDIPFPWGFESGDLYTSSPTWAGGTLYFGSGDGHVYAVDPRSGRTRWRFATGGRVRASPAVANGRVYTGSADGTLYALGAKSGRELWRFDTEGHTLESGKFGFDRRTVEASPSVADGRVFIGSRDGFLYAVDAATGNRHGGWTIRCPGSTPRPPSPTGWCTPAARTSAFSRPWTRAPAASCGACPPNARCGPHPRSPATWSTWATARGRCTRWIAQAVASAGATRRGAESSPRR